MENRDTAVTLSLEGNSLVLGADHVNYAILASRENRESRERERENNTA